ncbi:hypothetical protein AVEN_35826-1 [Araneus ventricosus]|uniref:Uncharacterized protein n=1 Tax=Araneus ventricosus TaxID=182803 RepID=A0A4Y2BJY3_ARAVE|nr:hypothetical protein AVEN_35826-1 [Araneus ventricosus]
MLMHLSHRFISAPLQLHKILWVAVSSTAGVRVERRHHLQSVCFQDVVLVDQTDEKSSWSVLSFIVWSTKKQHLGSKRFGDDDDVQHELLLWMRQQPRKFYAAAMGR